MKTIITFAILLALVSCEDHTNLGNGYYFDLDPMHELEILKEKNDQSGFEIVVEPRITKKAVSDKFLLIERARRYYDWYHHLGGNKYHDRMNRIEYNKWKSKDTVRFYYIIDKTTDSVFGELSLDQFNAKRKQLGIPDSLELHK